MPLVPVVGPAQLVPPVVGYDGVLSADPLHELGLVGHSVEVLGQFGQTVERAVLGRPGQHVVVAVDDPEADVVRVVERHGQQEGPLGRLGQIAHGGVGDVGVHRRAEVTVGLLPGRRTRVAGDDLIDRGVGPLLPWEVPEPWYGVGLGRERLGQVPFAGPDGLIAGGREDLAQVRNAVAYRLVVDVHSGGVRHLAGDDAGPARTAQRRRAVRLLEGGPARGQLVHMGCAGAVVAVGGDRGPGLLVGDDQQDVRLHSLCLPLPACGSEWTIPLAVRPGI